MVSLASIIAFLAAVLFFALATFTVTLGSVPELAAGLLCLAIALCLERLALAANPGIGKVTR
jgi:hypothetical protein